MQRLLRALTPFILLGITIAVFLFGLILLAYLFMIGACIGLVLFTVNWIKHKFFTINPPPIPKAKTGRIIDSDEWRKL